MKKNPPTDNQQVLSFLQKSHWIAASFFGISGLLYFFAPLSYDKILFTLLGSIGLTLAMLQYWRAEKKLLWGLATYAVSFIYFAYIFRFTGKIESLTAISLLIASICLVLFILRKFAIKYCGLDEKEA